MLRGLGAALAKDLRLLARDRAGLVFLGAAPIVVITVAGLSLATLYGAEPRGGTAPVVPFADEDGGWVGRAVRDRLAEEPSVRVRPVATAEAARVLVQAKRAAAALVVPAGTSDAVAAGRPAALALLTDPVKTVDVAYVRALTQELRHGLETAAVERAQHDLDAAHDEAAGARSRLAHALEDLRHARDDLGARSQAMRADAERGLRPARAAARARLVAALGPLRAFLAELASKRQAFAEWLAAVRERAGRFADRVPPPPEPPSVPRALEELASAEPDELAARLVPEDTVPPLAPPALPALDLPSLPEPRDDRLPAPLAIEETSVTGAPRRLNTFDQNVPGFGVTFLLLGVLLGVSLGLLDEHEWGTLDRLRSTPMPLGTVLVAKLAARSAVGTVQMAVLFAVGWLAFGISLGPEPWALALPTAGIAFAGTAFGLTLAALAPSREAVLPLGSIVIMSMAAVGGCWWPIDLEPAWMRRVALAFPTTWAMEAYNDLMIRRQGAGAVLGATAILFAYGAAYLAAGLALFRRRVLRAV